MKTPPKPGRHLHFDCVSGAAGDMTLGALFDLGVPREVVLRAVEAMGIESDRITATVVIKGGIAAVDVKVRGDDPEPAAHGHHHDHDHDHDHEHHHDHPHAHHAHHAHYPYSSIRERLHRADLDDSTRALAFDMFERIARAEAALHGTTVDEVHFHEVGAIDSIVDVVGAAAAISYLAPASVTCPSVAMGHGKVRCAHGALPVPSPAALAILGEAGAVIEGGGVAKELCTPTGAAILAAVVTEWGPCPPLRPEAIGYGAGDRDLADRPNVMRAIVGVPASPTRERIEVIEANVDDMSPELASYVADCVFAAGAVDVWWTPIVMKKSRPAFQLGVMAPVAAFEAVVEAILRESTTLGVRHYTCERRILDRELVEVATAFGPLVVVVARDGDRVLRAVPEHEPCRRAAQAFKVPIRDVYLAAQRAYQDLTV